MKPWLVKKESGLLSISLPTVRVFSAAEIRAATNNFSTLIGKGGFGSVYRGTIDDGSTTKVVAVKVWDTGSNQSLKEFRTEVEVLSKVRHRNVVTLLGYYEKSLCLVYEYMAHGSLSESLFSSNYKGLSLNWLQRLKICIGAARGLDYLHCGFSTTCGIIHGDVKTSNFLLDENFDLKISDFGISKLVSQDEPLDYTDTDVKGTHGYIDPHYFYTHHLSRKSDVYSFGVVLLEVLCGRKAVEYGEPFEVRILIEWVQPYLKEGKLEYILDPRLSGEILRNCLTEFAKIAGQCLHKTPTERPRMSEVLARLEYSLALQETKDSSQVERVVSVAGDFDGSLHKSPREHANRITAGMTMPTVPYLLALPDAKGSHDAATNQEFADSSVAKGKITDAIVSLTLNFNRNPRKPPATAGVMTSVTLVSSSGGDHDGHVKKIQFSLAEIRRATRNFDKDLIIGQGGMSGKVYKGLLDDGSSRVAIKQLDCYPNRGTSKFREEIDLLLEFRHRHLESLLGYCSQVPEVMLVFEYVPRGNLAEHLHKVDTPLSWVQRLKICIGAARGLDYLHCGTPIQDGIIHRNIKSSNILLDDKWEAKISGLDLSNIIHGKQSDTHVSTCIVGNYGYIDPDYIRTARLTRKSDVYSFGVVLFEVLCGRKALDSRLEDEQIGLAKWAQHCLEEKLLDMIIDPRLSGQVLPNHLMLFAQLADQCLHTSPRKRPTMAEVVTRLEYLLALQERGDSSTVEGELLASNGITQLANLSRHSRVNPADKMKFRRKARHIISGAAAVISGKRKDRKVNLLKLDTRGDSSQIIEVVNNVPALDEEIELELKQVEYYIKEGEVLNRMKDFLHLILFYPMKPDAEIDFPSLTRKFLSFSVYIRRLQESANHGVTNPARHQLLADVAPFFHDIQEHLADAAFNLEPYLPEDMVRNMCELPESGKWSGKSLTLGPRSELMPSTSTKFEVRRLVTEEFMLPDLLEIHAGAIDSAIYRASECIKEMTFRKLGISGIHAKEVAKALKNLPEIRSMFGLVLFVSASKYQSIREIRHEIDEQVDLWKKGNQGVVETRISSPELHNCLLFLDCSDDSINLHDFELHYSKRFRYLQLVITTRSRNAYRLMNVSLEIRTGDHLLPWNLFLKNVGQAWLTKASYGLHHMAARIVEECHGHLLAIILLARALQGLTDVSVWELALHELTTSQRQPLSLGVEGVSDVMVGVLRFIWPLKHIVSKICLQHFAEKGTQMEIKNSLISSWVEDGTVETQKEGEDAFEDLISAFLLEKVGESSVRMRDETRFVLLCKFIPRAHPLTLKLDGLALKETPRVGEWDAMEIELSNNELSELPEYPNCPILVKLSLRLNPDLVEIPLTFFERMRSLQVLDLSNTSIKNLPPSLSKLVALRDFFMRDCELLMELPPEIGTLRNLKLLDFEGTELIYLPDGLQRLSKLECLKVSLYRCADHFKESKNLKSMIPEMAISSLSCLKELGIYVDPDVEWWDAEVKCIIDQLSKLRNLKTLRLHIPTLELLHIFLDTMSPERGQMYPSLSHFRLMVGRNQQRMVSRLPLDLEEMFLKLEKCLKYSNGEGSMELITRTLKHATAFYLDRHWTIQSLTTLIDHAEMDKLEFCLLVECNEMQAIVNGNEISDSADDTCKGDLKESALGLLRYLSIHYMKNLSCIWKGPIRRGCLSSLMTLALHVCPELTTIFTMELLGSLTSLKYLVVEGCPKITSLVSVGSSSTTSNIPFLSNLRSISLLDLPELLSISSGVHIAPKLERMVIYNCLKLERLSTMEVSSIGIKEIKGETEWWDDLKWHNPDWSNGRPGYLTRAFVPLGNKDGDLMDEIPEIGNSLQQLTQDYMLG